MSKTNTIVVEKITHAQYDLRKIEDVSGLLRLILDHVIRI